jgi:hypothetical protein
VALRAKLRANRRLARERRMDESSAAGSSLNPIASPAGDLRPVLDEELNRLPEKYRAPVVLCYLEGKTNEEAARQLQWPAGTVKIRLSRARELLRNRLTRRGLALSAGALALALTQEAATAAVPQALALSVTQAAAGGALAGGAGALADATVKAMTAFKLKVAASAVLAVSVVAAGAIHLANRDGGPLQLRATLANHTDGVMGAAFFPDSRSLATGSGDQVIRIWNAQTGQETGTLTGHRRKILSLAMSPNGMLLASGEGDVGGQPGAVKLWDLSRRRELATLPEQEEGVPSLDFAPDNRVLATACWGGTVRLWDVATQRLIHELKGHQSGVAGVRFSPDGKLLASASNDQTVKLWDPATGNERATLRGHTDVVHALAFSPDGSVIATGSRDGSIRLWDAKTYEQRQVIQTGSMIYCLSYAPGGHRLLSGHPEVIDGGEVGVLKLWDVQQGQMIASLRVHKEHVGSAVFSPDGKLLVTTSWDKTAKLWDVNTGSRAWAPSR